jgi:hypothetical protein
MLSLLSLYKITVGQPASDPILQRFKQLYHDVRVFACHIVGAFRVCLACFELKNNYTPHLQFLQFLIITSDNNPGYLKSFEALIRPILREL